MYFENFCDLCTRQQTAKHNTLVGWFDWYLKFFSIEHKYYCTLIDRLNLRDWNIYNEKFHLQQENIPVSRDFLASYCASSAPVTSVWFWQLEFRFWILFSEKRNLNWKWHPKSISNSQFNSEHSAALNLAVGKPDSQHSPPRDRSRTQKIHPGGVSFEKNEFNYTHLYGLCPTLYACSRCTAFRQRVGRLMTISFVKIP